MLRAGRALLAALLCAAAALVALPAWAAGLPPAYGAVVVQPAGLPVQAEFDLGPAVQRARREGKRLYVYLGAEDCRYCRKYEAFLAQHAAELLPHFQRDYVLVDLRSRLSVLGNALFLRLGEQRWTYTEFQRAIGDERARLLVYPNVWLLDADLKPLLQMPSGAGTFSTVAEQLEILRLEQ
jgi:hypothetical protein